MDTTDSEYDPLMEEGTEVRDTTRQFLRSFSILSDDSDFDELDEPDTPGDFLDAGPDVEPNIRPTTTSGIRFETGTKPPDTGRTIVSL